MSLTRPHGGLPVEQHGLRRHVHDNRAVGAGRVPQKTTRTAYEKIWAAPNQSFCAGISLLHAYLRSAGRGGWSN